MCVAATLPDFASVSATCQYSILLQPASSKSQENPSLGQSEELALEAAGYALTPRSPSDTLEKFLKFYHF